MRMKLFICIVAASLFSFGCSSSHKHAENKELHTHEDGHHEHEGEEEHEHEHEHEHELEGDEAHEGEHGHEHTKGKHANEIVMTPEQMQAAHLKTETIHPTSFRNVIHTSGQIQASQGDEQTVVATSAGIVTFASHAGVEGTPLRSGETVALISAKKLQEGDEALKAKLAFETAEKEFKRAESLIADKIISTKEFEQTKLRYETARAAYQGIASNVSENGVRVTSPINGYLKNRLVNQGDYVNVGEPIATVTQNQRLQLRAEVSEKEYKNLRNISDANFRTAYDDNTTYKLSEMNGRLLSYGKAASNQSFYIPVTFEFDNVGNIVAGAYAEIYLLASPRDNVISVPVSALTEEQGLNFVYVQIEPDAFMKREVVVGQNNGERAEIKSGLKEGDNVVVNGAIQVKLASMSGAIPEGHNHNH